MRRGDSTGNGRTRESDAYLRIKRGGFPLMTIKYFESYTSDGLMKASDNAFRERTYIEIMKAFEDIEENEGIRDQLVAEIRTLLDKPTLTKLEAIIMQIVLIHTRSELELAGKE